MKKATEVHTEIPIAFTRKKESILRQLNVPSETYDDLSPKGSVDAEIRDFVDEINSYEGLVTTSSCSGRSSVFLEGQKSEAIGTAEEDGDGEGTIDVAQQGSTDGDGLNKQNYASNSGKGGGGRWLFVSHNPISTASKSYTALFNMHCATSEDLPFLSLSLHRLIHFKFEPMILHILAATPRIAQQVLAAAQQSGFRESGASTVPSSTSTFNHSNAPIPLAIRTTGIAFDNIIGFCNSSTVREEEHLEALVLERYLRSLVLIANEKFRINKARTERFRGLLAEAFGSRLRSGDQWEETNVRRERKRAEGLRKRDELRLKEAGAREAFVATNDDAH